MLLTREDGCVLSDDKALLDVERVYEWLSKDAYWALGRDLPRVRASIEGSDAYGIYDADQVLVGFCRVVTDGATFSWLCDVYIDPEQRGRGLGTWMVDEVRAVYAATGMRRMLLATNDAHEVYRKVGFEPLAAPERWMEIEFNPPQAL
jgi:GNAT superfamily N-acetyltransferase